MAKPLTAVESLLAESRARRERDARAFEQLDDDTCMLCHAHGQDKRSLRIDCFYAVDEVVPEALDLGDVHGERGYYLRICKSCRGALLDRLGGWRDERVALRDAAKDYDGYVLEEEPGGADPRNIPVRKNGRIVYLTEAEWRAQREASR